MINEDDNKTEENQDSKNNTESETITESDELAEVFLEDKLKEAEDKTISESDELAGVFLKDKLKEAEDKTLRALAETENQRRRFENETKEAFEYGGFNLARETLSVLDNLQRAYQSIKNDENFKNNKDLDKFLENIRIIEKDLITVFEKNNIKKINCLNEKFNPNNHQAMLEMEDENADPGTILQEIQPGYFYKDRLLRPSFVAVAKKKDINNGENKDK
jgi:molecular chaperone GrpE